jgi:hypothetical protein
MTSSNQLPNSDNSVFAFKCTIPRDKQLNYIRQNTREWKFEQCHTPTDYTSLSRRGKSGFIARNLGENYVSHWNQKELVKEERKPEQPQKTRQEPLLSHQTRTVLPVQETQEQLYRAMFVVLAGQSQLERIEKSYRMRNRGPNVKRHGITISELID